MHHPKPLARLAHTRGVPLLHCLLICTLAPYSCTDPSSTPQGQAEERTKTPTDVAPDPAAVAAQARKEALDRDFPLHGLITGLQLKVHLKADPDSLTIGWLRAGSRIRLASTPTKTNTCRSGFYPISPRGFACAGEGIEIKDAPPQSSAAHTPAARDAALPYAYYFVKEPMVPEYHRLPSRNEQRAARDYVARYLALKADNGKKAAKFLAGDLKKEPKRLKLIRRHLDRGFFVAGAAIEERSSRKFVRTVRGSYIKLSQLEQRSGPSFKGVALNVAGGAPGTAANGTAQPPPAPAAVAPQPISLPLAWAVRTARPFKIVQREDGTQKRIADESQEPFPRLSLVPWEKLERVGGQIYHRLKDGRYLKFWFLAVAEVRARPKGIGPEDPWVHINLEQQTLVAYRGDSPVYATLVSSGLPEHPTAVGLFDIRTKQVSATMSDIGPDVGKDDRYSISDVPWTQYFDGSIALHAAFWHERFGLPRSHGCVNLAPRDAHALFNITWPNVPDGWHGATTEKTGFATSKVWVTEK